MKVRFTPQAERDLGALDKATAQRILDKIKWLSENFASIRLEPLHGPWQGAYKLRVGDYRVIFTLAGRPKDTILIHLIGHRRDIYKQR